MLKLEIKREKKKKNKKQNKIRFNKKVIKQQREIIQDESVLVCATTYTRKRNARYSIVFIFRPHWKTKEHNFFFLFSAYSFRNVI